MAYRAHVVVYGGDGQRLSVAALKKLRALDRNGNLTPLAPAGTRYGAPGYWVESERKPGFATEVGSLVGKLADRGLRVRVYATNDLSLAALGFGPGFVGPLTQSSILSVQRG